MLLTTNPSSIQSEIRCMKGIKETPANATIVDDGILKSCMVACEDQAIDYKITHSDTLAFTPTTT